MARPARKKSVLVFIELLRVTPMPRTNAKYRARINQSIPVILERLLPLDYLPIRGTRSATQMRVYEARSVHEVASLPQANAPTPNAGVFGFPEPQFFDLTKAMLPFYRSELRSSPVLLCGHLCGSGFEHAIQIKREWTAGHGGRSRGHAAPVGPSRRSKSSRHEVRLRNRLLRCVHRAHWRARRAAPATAPRHPPRPRHTPPPGKFCRPPPPPFPPPDRPL